MTQAAHVPRALFERIKREAATGLAGVFDGFFARAVERVENRQSNAASKRLMQREIEMLQRLERAAPACIDEYRQRIVAGFDRWLAAAPAVAQLRVEGHLSLMSDSELQAQLAGESIREELAQAGDVLARFEARIEQLAIALGASRRPTGPLQPPEVVEAFLDAFPLDELDQDLRELLFDLYEERLVSSLVALLSRLDAELSGAGYEMQGEVAPPRPQNSVTTQRRPPQRAEPPRAQPQPDTGWVPEGGTVERISRTAAPASATGAATSAPSSTSAATPVGNVAAAAPTASASRSPSPAPGDPPASEAVAKPEGQPMRYRDLVHERLRAWRQEMGVAANDAQGPRIGTAELGSIAALLQGDDARGIARVLSGEDRQPLSQVLRDAVASGGRQLGLLSGPARFAPDEEDAIDLVAMLFQSLAETSAAAKAWPALYARLVMPYLRLVLVDDSLFNRRTHPARRLLDELTGICENDHGEEDAESLGVAHRAVERVVAGFREDLEIFDLAADELRQFQDQQRRRAEHAERRAAESVHGRERLGQARADSRAVLAGLLQERPLTDAFADFLKGPWRHARDQAWLREGADGARCAELTRLAGDLVALDASAALPGQADLVERWLALEPQVTACCDAASPDAAATRETLARMVFALAHPEAGRGVHAPPGEDEAEDAQSQVKQMLRLVTDHEVEHDPVIASRMRRLRAGQALQVIEEDGTTSFARVSWVSPLTGRFLIVNRRGQRKLVVSPEQLAALVGAGRIALRTTHAPSDLAIKRLWYQLSTAQGEAVADSA